MKNLKKVMALVIVLSMVVSMFTVMTASAADFEDVVGTVYEEAVMTLAPMGVIAGYEEGESVVFKPEQVVTRAEMAAFIIRALGLGATAKADTDFTDVPKDFWGSGAIKIANKRNIVVGYGDGTFGPDDQVSFEAAVKMLVCALGYEEDAKDNGGWSVGYLTVADKADIDLLAGLEDKLADPTAGCDRGTVALLLHNALDVNIQNVTYYNGEVLSKTLTGNTMLSEMGYYKFSEVVIDATDKATASDKEIRKDGYIALDGYNNLKMKDGGYDLNPYLGQKVTLYASYDKTLKEYTVVSVVGTSVESDVVVLDVADIVKAMVGNKLYFYVDKESSSKTDYYTLAPAAELEIVYNNAPVAELERDYSLITDNSNGTITLIDSEGEDGIFEKAVVETYKNYQVADIDVDENTLIFTNNTEIELDNSRETNKPKFTILNAEGTELALADLAEDDVVSIYSNVYPLQETNGVDYVTGAATLKIVACNETVEGVVTQTQVSADKVYIDGEAYEVTDNIDDPAYDLEAEGIYFLDFNGKIAFADADPVIDNFEYAFDGSQDGRKITLNTIDANGEEKEYQMASTVKVNNVPYSLSKDADCDALVAALKIKTDQYGGLTDKYIVSLKTNSDGKVTRINLIGAVDTDTSIYSRNDSMLGDYPLTGKTVIFSTPKGAFDAEDIKVLSKDSLNNDKEYEYVIYQLDKNNNVTAMVVYSKDGEVDENNDIAVIQSVSTVKEGDDTVLSLTMIQGGKVVTVKTAEIDSLDNYIQTDKEGNVTDYSDDAQYGDSYKVAYGAYPGQIIAYATNSTGAITGDTYRLFPRHTTAADWDANGYDYWKNMKFQTWNYTPDTVKANADLIITAGTVNEVNTKNGTIEVATKAVGVDTTVNISYTNARIVVVDTNNGLAEDLAVRVGKSTDIKKNDYVVVRRDRNTVKDIVVYKSFKTDWQ